MYVRFWDLKYQELFKILNIGVVLRVYFLRKILLFFFYYMRLLLRLQFILHENITDMYKSDYNWDQHTSNLMEHCPNFNPLKYSRDVYSSHWGKEADCLHSILFEERNIPTCIVGVRTAALQLEEQQLFGRVARKILLRNKATHTLSWIDQLLGGFNCL